MRTNLETRLFTKKSYLLFLIGVVAIYFALAIGSAMTKSPWSDEAWFANPAVNLITRGRMSTPVLETAGTGFKGLDQHTYWVMPLHLVTQAGWYKIFGFSLLSMRALSAVWGVLALFSWFFIIRTLSGNQKVALLAFVLLAFDYIFIMAASFGRMDMMSSALGATGLAAYLLLRERNFARAILLSHSLIVACGLTHPNGGVLFLAGLLFLIYYFDRSQVRWRHLGLAMIPYIIGAIGWGAYILEAPSLFLSQFSANAAMSGRMSGLTSPLAAIKNEITLRYLTAFGLGPHSVSSSGPIKLKIFILLAYVIAIIGCISVRSIRQHRGYRALLLLTGIYFIVLTFFDGQKLAFYLVHIVPLYTALLAAWLYWCYNTHFVPAWMIALCVGGFISLQLGGVLYRMKLNPYEKSYLSAVNFLKQNANERSLVMGSAVLGFGLGYDNLIDDVRLGFYSGKKPDFIVIGETYQEALRDYHAGDPELSRHINKLLTQEYREVYNQNFYQIYARR